jgi:hypothetical protein
MAPRTDAEAIAASLSEPRAFVAVFDRHFDAIHRYLRRRVGNAIADELASEAFAQASSTGGAITGAVRMPDPGSTGSRTTCCGTITGTRSGRSARTPGPSI